MSTILAIDPGTEESGYVLKSRDGILDSGVVTNVWLLDAIRDGRLVIQYPCPVNTLAIEMIASYGMPVGKEVFETCLWIGRFMEAWESRSYGFVRLVYRKDVKMHLCGSPRAKDPHIRQRLLDLIGPQGTKKQPGPTYGVKSHAWAALAVAVTAEAA